MRIVGRSEGSGREKKKIQFGIAFPLCLEVVCIPVCQSRRRREVFSPQGQGEMKKTLHTVGSSTNREWKTLKMGRMAKKRFYPFCPNFTFKNPPLPFPLKKVKCVRIELSGGGGRRGVLSQRKSFIGAHLSPPY